MLQVPGRGYSTPAVRDDGSSRARTVDESAGRPASRRYGADVDAAAHETHTSLPRARSVPACGFGVAAARPASAASRAIPIPIDRSIRLRYISSRHCCVPRCCRQMIIDRRRRRTCSGENNHRSLTSDGCLRAFFFLQPAGRPAGNSIRA